MSFAQARPLVSLVECPRSHKIELYFPNLNENEYFKVMDEIPAANLIEPANPLLQ